MNKKLNWTNIKKRERERRRKKKECLKLELELYRNINEINCKNS